MNQFGFILSKTASVFRLHDYFNVCRGTKVRPHKTNLWIVFHACPFMQIQFGKAILIFMSIIISLHLMAFMCKIMTLVNYTVVSLNKVRRSAKPLVMSIYILYFN